MNRAALHASGVACLALLTWPVLLMGKLHEDSVAYVRRVEKRMPRELPNVTLRALSDEGFYGGLGDFLRDRLPLRSDIVELKNMIELRVFGADRSGPVERGSDGWLYYGPSLSGSFESEETTDEALELLGGLLARHAEDGPPLLFLVAPDKHTIHPEHLRPGSLRRIEPSLRLRERLRRAVSAACPAQSIDLWRTLGDERERTGRDVFWPLDTHWNRHGQAAVAEAIVRFFEPEAWTAEPIVIARKVERWGDLARLIHAGIPRSTDDRIVFRDPNRESTSTDLGYERPAAQFRTRSGRRLVPGRSLFLHDSFGHAMWWLLPAYFEDLTCIHLDNLDEESFAELSTGYERVIFEVAERNAVHTLRRLLGQSGEALEALPDDRLLEGSDE